MIRDYIDDPWIGVDLDGTLAYYDGWKGIEHIGEPIPEMLRRVKLWLDEGKDVRIFTARVGEGNDPVIAACFINGWCKKHLGRVLPVTCSKDSGMVELWDDRCVQVVPNEGIRVEENLLNLMVDIVGCPYQHFTDIFYKNSEDPNLPGWYFHLCGSGDRFTCRKTEKIVANCWLRFVEGDHND